MYKEYSYHVWLMYSKRALNDKVAPPLDGS